MKNIFIAKHFDFLNYNSIKLFDVCGLNFLSDVAFCEKKNECSNYYKMLNYLIWCLLQGKCNMPMLDLQFEFISLELCVISLGIPIDCELFPCNN